MDLFLNYSSGGGKPIPEELKSSINAYLKENSISSKRVIRDKQNLDNNNSENTSKRYLNDNGVELYRNFPYKNQLSKSSFLKYLKATGIYKLNTTGINKMPPKRLIFKI